MGWEDDEEKDAYDRQRPSDWDTIAEARDAANASPVLREGAVLISWPRPAEDGRDVRYGWRGSDLGMDLPPRAEILEEYRHGSWGPNVNPPPGFNGAPTR